MIHKTLSEGRWFTLSLAEQLGNVGTEFERVMKAKQQGNSQREEKSLARFLELLDLTLQDSRWSGSRRRELARLREQSLTVLEDGKSLEGLRNYYQYFAFLARANH